MNRKNIDSDSDTDERITLQQCQCALQCLGYAQNLLRVENLKEILLSNRQKSNTNAISEEEIIVDFEEFCILTTYLTVYQQEISESGCVSPIKGNLPPPPIYLTNNPG